MLVLVAQGALPAQVEHPRSFEVASVRLTTPRTPPVVQVTNTRVALVNISLKVLILRAFKVARPSQLAAPDWLADVSVDINAKIPEGSRREHVPEMLQRLLITRFGLRVHAEARPTDVYELVVGGGGIRMREVQAANELEKEFPTDGLGKAPMVDAVAGSLGDPLRVTVGADRAMRIITKTSMFTQTHTSRGTIELESTRMTMGELASALDFILDRPVVDGTKLTGVYRFRVELPPPQPLIGDLGSATRTDGTLADPSGGSAFKAVESLGLKLESRRVPLDTLVVDHIDRVPSEN